MKIDGIGIEPKVIENNSPNKAKDNGEFSNILKKSLEEVNNLQNEADASIKNIAAGKMDNIQDAAIAIEKADVSLRLLTQIRNKAVDAYKQIMRMQV